MGNAADISLVRRAIINYSVIRGDTFAPPPVSFRIDGVDESFSGCTVTMEIKTNDGARIIKTLTVGDGISISGNVVQYTVSAVDMAEWKMASYKYVVQKTDGSAIKSTIQSGTITLL